MHLFTKYAFFNIVQNAFDHHSDQSDPCRRDVYFWMRKKIVVWEKEGGRGRIQRKANFSLKRMLFFHVLLRHKESKYSCLESAR